MSLLFPGLSQCDCREMQLFILPGPAERGEKAKHKVCALQTAMPQGFVGALKEHPWKGRAGDQSLLQQNSVSEGQGIAFIS